MIIIKPDLVIKWANSNLVLHRVREHLCVFLCSHLSIHLYISEYTCDCAWEFEYARALCVWDCVSGESAAEERHIYGKVWLDMETAIIFLLARKEEEKNTNISPHPFSFSSLFSILHTLSPAFSLSLSVSLTKAAVSSKMRPRTEGMQMKSLLVD